MKTNRKNESVKTVVFNKMRNDAPWGTRSLIENDNLWDEERFWDEVNDWSFEKMIDGLDFGYNEEGYASVA